MEQYIYFVKQSQQLLNIGPVNVELKKSTAGEGIISCGIGCMQAV